MGANNAAVSSIDGKLLVNGAEVKAASGTVATVAGTRLIEATGHAGNHLLIQISRSSPLPAVEAIVATTSLQTSVRDDEAEVMIGSLDEAPTDLTPQYDLWRVIRILPRIRYPAIPCQNQAESLV